MSDRYDEHLSFDLPYGYEAAIGQNDEGERTFSVLCGTSLNDEGETTGEMKMIFRRIEGQLGDDKVTLSGELPACDFGRKSEISMNVSLGRSSGRTLSIDILIYIVAVGGDDAVYALIGTKVSKGDAFYDNCEIVAKHMNAVLKSMTLDGRSPRLERIDGSRVARIIREGAASEDGDVGDVVRPLDNTKGLHIDLPGKKPAADAPAPKPEPKPALKPEPAPEPEETPEEKARREEEERRKAEEEAKKEKAWKAWLGECEAVRARRADALARLQQKRRSELRAAAQNARDEALGALNAERRQAEADRETAEKTLASLGIFKFAEKKRQKALLERLADVTLPALKKREEEIGAAYGQAVAAIEGAISGEKSALTAETERLHPLPEQPEKPASVLEKERAEAAARAARYDRMSDSQKRHERMKTAIWQYLYDCGVATVSDLLENVPALEGESNQIVSALCRALVLAGSIKKETRMRRTYFHADNPPDALPSPSPSSASSSFEGGLTQTQQRNEVLKAAILEGLAEFGPMTIDQMVERIPALEGDSFQHVSALCRALVLAGSVEKYSELRRTYFRIP